MPRAYGISELQMLVDAAFHAGFTMRGGRASYEPTDVPRAVELLKSLGIVHHKAVPFDPKKPRSWHPQKDKSNAADRRRAT